MAQTTSLFFQDEILPGVLTEIEHDYNYGEGYYKTDWGTTDTVLVLGTAFSGPINKVVQIYSPEHALHVYGGAYDTKASKEASLVSSIKDVYDRGCRAIYACRISGKEIYKDFDIAPNLNCKLRVSGKYPSNLSKDVYFRFVNDADNGIKFIYYKPASMATVYEKLNGIVESMDSTIETVLNLSGTYGYTDESRLVDLINIVNTSPLNNAITLSLVDNDGNNIASTIEAQSIPVNALFEGVYFIGRTNAKQTAITVVDEKIPAPNDFWSKYKNIDSFKVLTLNTDVDNSYPISGKDLNSVLTEITLSSEYSFVKNLANVDVISTKDNIDYEEVDISGFELYKKLGSGFATTAHIVKKDGINAEKEDGTPNPSAYRVEITSEDDPNRIVPLIDGVYSFLQNVPSSYRVLAHVCASDSAAGIRPKKSDFLVKTAGKTTNVEIGGKNVITISPVVDDKSDTETNYQFEISKLSDNTIDLYNNVDPTKCEFSAQAVTYYDSLNAAKDGETCIVFGDTTKLYKKTDIKSIDLASEYGDILNNKYFYANSKLFKISDGALKEIGQSDSENGKYFIVAGDYSDCVAYVADGNVTLLGSIAQVFTDDNSGLYTAQSMDNSGLTKIMLTEDYLTSSTYSMLVEDLNKTELAKRFTFDVHNDIKLNSNAVIGDVLSSAITTESVAFAKEIYDTNMYIPYTTTDNFVRQLAQHCTYTSLKTSATHGVIGYKKLGIPDTTVLANEVVAAVNADYDLYAKKNNGRNMLDKNNLPYNIGRNVSVVFGSSYVSIDGYTYYSSGVGYAGMVSTLAVEQSSTNQPIALDSLLFELSNYQLKQLTQAGYVTFKDSYTKGIVVSDGITMAPASSEFRRLSTARIIGATESLIRAAAEPFIGIQNSLANRNALKTAIRSNLNKVVGVFINDYNFTVTSDVEQQKLGYIDIEYGIVPFYEIRQIRNRITIKDSI